MVEDVKIYEENGFSLNRKSFESALKRDMSKFKRARIVLRKFRTGIAKCSTRGAQNGDGLLKSGPSSEAFLRGGCRANPCGVGYDAARPRPKETQATYR